MLHKYLPGDTRERIKDLLLESDMNQEELAEKLGIAGSSLNRYLSGQTEKLSTEHIVSMAKIFNVSTDFLLCLTDIPFMTNYDIEKLGLSTKAAKMLLKKEYNMDILNLLLVSPDFVLFVRQLKQLYDGTLSAAFSGMNQMIDSCTALVWEYGQQYADKRRAVKEVTAEIQSKKLPEYKADLSAIEATFQRMIDHLREGGGAYMEDTRKLTSWIMETYTSDLKKSIKDPMKLRGITPEMFVKPIMEKTQDLEMTDEAREKFHDGLLALFSSLALYTE